MFLIKWFKLFIKARRNCKRSVENKKTIENFTSDIAHDFSVYDSKKESIASKKHHWIHYVFKYKIVMPFVYAIEKGLKKYYTKPTNKWHDKYFRIWDTAFHKSLYDWKVYYNLGGDKFERPTGKPLSDYKIKKLVEKSPLARMYRMGFYGIVGNDTAYREFLPIFMLNLSNKMSEKIKEKEIHHLFYTHPNIYDINYYSSGYDLQNRFHIKNVKTHENSIPATKAENGTLKAYFTGKLDKGTDGLLDQAKVYSKLIDENKYMFLGVTCNTGSINNIEFNLLEL